MGFRINYSKVISQANKVAEDASQLSAQIKYLEQLEQECRDAWKGEAADVFLGKLRELRNEMTRTKGQMTTLASTIKNCADRIQQEDEEAVRRATKLSSGR